MSRARFSPALIGAVLIVCVIVAVSLLPRAEQSQAQAVPPTSVVRAYVLSQRPHASSFNLHAGKVNSACKTGCVYRVWGTFLSGAIDQIAPCRVDPAGTRVRKIVLQRYRDEGPRGCNLPQIFGPLRGQL